MPVSTPPTAPTAGVPTIVVVGHGMVGQRFLEALADRGLTPRRVPPGSSCSARSPAPRTTASS